MARTFVVGPRGGVVLEDAGAGRGLPVVLVHGAAGRSEHWAGVAARLRAARRVVALDLPGHGLSDAPRDLDWSVEALSEALHLATQEVGLARFALVGHSLAGAVVAEHAAAHPDRVAALAILDAGPRTPTRADVEELRRGFRPQAYEAFAGAWFEELLEGARPETRTEVMGGLRQMPRANFMALVYGNVGFDMAAAAARYRGPKLALCAEAFRMAERWAGQPGVEVKVIPGVSHWLQLDAPEAVARELEAFVARAT